MKIRWKLLLVMLCISLVPILLMRGFGERSVRVMGDVLSSRIKDVLIQRATIELTILVEEHARIMQLERKLIERALKTQAEEIEECLLKVREHNEMPLSILPPCRSVMEELPEYILWQITAFEDGTQTIYPRLDPYPAGYDALAEPWYRGARESKGFFWSQAVVEPFGGTFSFIVAAPLLDGDGAFVGATAIVVPVSLILHQDAHIRNLSENVSYLIVRPGYSKRLGAKALRIVAREHKAGQAHHHWKAAESEEWLVADDPDMNVRLLKDVTEHASGVVEFSADNENRVAAFGSIDAFGSFLMLVVNKADILVESTAMEDFIHQLISRQLTVSSIILVAVVIAVICLALLLSRSMTQRIRKLVKASQRVAAGDFNTRAGIVSRDEIGELGRTFDQMVPVLEDRIQMKKALDVAKEIQQSLLPQHMPHIAGLDIAARSIYCDETGGDFFDFMDFCCKESSVSGVVVGDVSGHGIPAALLMASVRAFLRSRVMQPGNVSEIVNDVNRLLVKDADETVQFVTLFYAEIDMREKKIEWVRAGHDPAFIYQPDTGMFEDLWGKGIPLGIEDDAAYESKAVAGLKNGQIIVIGTDGVWETCNAGGDMYGKDRLKAIVQKNASSGSQTILSTIFQDLNQFRGEVKQEDDVTLVVIKLDPASE